MATTFDRRRSIMYAADISGRMARWDMKTGTCNWWTNQLTKTVIGVAHSSDGERLASISLDDKIRVSETKNNAYTTEAVGLPAKPIAVAGANATPNLFAVATEGPHVMLVRGGAVGEVVPVTFAPLSIAFSHDDTEVAVSGKLGAFAVFNVTATGLTAKRTLEGPAKNVNAIAYSADGKFLAAVDADRRVSVYDAARALKTADGWQYHSSNVTSVSFSPNSRRLATCSMDESIIVYNDLTGFVPEKKHTVSLTHQGGVIRIEWLDDNTLISVGHDRAIRLWDIPPLAA